MEMNNLEQIFRQKYPHKEHLSENWKDRPNGVDGIIIHSMGRVIQGHGFASDFLEKRGYSAHFLIDTDGAWIECVNPVNQAHHAGESKLGDQTNLNTSFIGIEVLVEGEWTYGDFLEAIRQDVFYDKQYDSAAVLCSLLCCEFDIPLNRVVKHSRVSGPDVRDDPKFDPGVGFKWSHFKTLTEEFINQLTA